MPRTLGGLLGFAITATVIVIVGTFIYNNVVTKAIAMVRSKAA